MQRKVYDYSPYAYKRKRNDGKKRNFYEVVKLIAIILIVIFVSVMLYSRFHKASTVLLSAKKYYAVEVGSYVSESTASYFGSTIKNRGGAGEVYYDESYRVFAAVYLSKADAVSVAQKMIESDLNGKLYVFEMSRTKAEFSNGQKFFLKDMANSFCKFLDTLIAASLDFDMDTVNSSEIILLAEDTLSDIDGYYNKVSNILGGDGKESALLKMQDFLLEQKTVISKLKSGTVDGVAIKTACFEMLFLCNSIYAYFGGVN